MGGSSSNLVWGCGLDLSYEGRDRPVVSSCGHDNETFGSIQRGEFLDSLSLLLASEEEVSLWWKTFVSFSVRNSWTVSPRIGNLIRNFTTNYN